MRSNLNAHEMPLHKIFNDEYLFTIPSVQRPYSWTADEVGELLDDLLEFINHYGINEKNAGDVQEPYFLGSIVLVKDQTPDSEVLDGQQRLTTLTILFSVIRDILGDDYADDIENMIVQKGNRMLGTKDTYRLHLRKRDDEFLKRHVQQKGATLQLNENTEVKTDSQRVIRDNTIYLRTRLKEIEKDKLETLPSTLATLCYIVVVSTPNFDSAFRIFTVLNDRGLDLLPSDIFKARVIGAIPDEEQDYYTDKWEGVEVSLGRNSFNKLFDHIRMIIQKRKGSANYKDEYDEIFSEINGRKFIDEMLVPYSDIYQKLVDYQLHYRGQPKVIRLLSLLNRIDNNDWVPVAMYYIRHSNTRLEEFFEKLEQFAGTSMVLRKNFNWRMSKYSQILRQMEKGINVFSDESMINVTEEDKKEVLEKLQGDVYTDLKDTVRRYVLLRIDSLLTEGQPYYDHHVITVEHVLPQNPKEDSEWLKKFTSPAEYVHKLGNLVLLTRNKNAQARNYDFEKKKKSYFQSKNGVTTFAVTTQVVQENEWTPEVVERRQKERINLLSKAWKLNSSTVANEMQSRYSETDSNYETYYIKATRNANASGTPLPDGFKVYKGSIIADSYSDSFQKRYKKIRRKLIDEGIVITNSSDNLELIDDHVFSSASTAASLVLGRSANGLTEWKTKEDKKLEENINSN